MQRAVSYFIGLLRSCHPNLGRKAAERHGPWVLLVTTLLSAVVDHTNLVVGDTDLRLVSGALVIATLGFMHVYRQEP